MEGFKCEESIWDGCGGQSVLTRGVEGGGRELCCRWLEGFGRREVLSVGMEQSESR